MSEILAKKVILAHKIELKLNNKQRTYCQKASGTARFAYNWALGQWKEQYTLWQADTSQEKPSKAKLNKYLNAIKYQEFPWMLEVTKCAPQQALNQLESAYQKFFKGIAKYPQFKKKGKSIDSFTIDNSAFKIGKNTKEGVDQQRILIPKLGWIKMRQEVRFKGKVLWATVSRTAQRWYVSISVELDDLSHLKPAESQGLVGVDLGLTALASLSSGQKCYSSKPLGQYLKKLQYLSRQLSKKVVGSSNRQKAKIKLAKLHARIKYIRMDVLHQLTSMLVSRFDIICIEDLNVKGLMKNHHLARNISDVGWYEFRRQLEYKSNLRQRQLIIADRFYPSSQVCSSCGYRSSKKPLNVRYWQCEQCSTEHDRDINAAKNLANYAKEQLKI